MLLVRGAEAGRGGRMTTTVRMVRSCVRSGPPKRTGLGPSLQRCVGVGGGAVFQVSPTRKEGSCQVLGNIIDGRLVGRQRRASGCVCGTSGVRGRGRPAEEAGEVEEAVVARNPLKLSQLQVLWALAYFRNRERAAIAAERTPYWTEVLVSRMEKTLGVLLFKGNPSDSGRYGGHLSDAGNLMLHYSEQILLLAHEAQVALADLNNARIGTLRLGACPTAAAYLATPLASRFLSRYPSLAFELKQADAVVVCVAVAAGHVDCGVIAQRPPSELADTLECAQVASEALLLTVAPSHPLATRRSITLEELYRLELAALSPSSGTSHIFHDELQAAGIATARLRTRRQVDSLDALRAFVAAGLGAAFLPASAAQEALSAGSIVQLPVERAEPQAGIYVVTNPARYCSQAQRSFLSEVFDAHIVCRIGGQLSAEEERMLNMLPLVQHRCQLRLSGDDSTEYSGSSPGARTEVKGRRRRGRIDWEPVSDALLESCGMLRPLTERGEWIRRMSLPIAQPSPDFVKPLPFTLKDLELFEAVDESKSLTEVAAAFKMTQPAFSYCIARLSKTFDTELTVKLHQGAGRQDVVFTDSGHLLHYYSKRIMRFAREALKAIADVRDVKTGTVCLGASQTTGTYLMPRLIGMFSARNPAVNVQLQVASSRQICAAVEAGEVDVAIVGGGVPEAMLRLLVATPYATDELVLIVPSQHPLASVKVIDKQDLFQLNFVSIDHGSSVQSVQASTLRQHGIKWSQLNITMEFNSVEAIKSAVRFNLGVAFVSSSSIEKELELGLVARVSIRGVRLLRTLFLVSNPSSYVSPAAKKFMVDILQMQPGGSPPAVAAAAGSGIASGGGGLSSEQAGGEGGRGGGANYAAGARQLASHMQSPRPWERASRGAVPQHLRDKDQAGRFGSGSEGKES